MDSGSLPPVSIITPVYNEAEYLAECIESVLAQTYSNWDYTIVDNCSTDGSLQVAHQYAAKDQRIRVLENQCLLPALPNYNRALRQISPKSKYCKVVFGDDWIFPECLQRMVAVAEVHPSVGIVGAYSLEGEQVKGAGLPFPSTLVSGREICRKQFIEELGVFRSPTNVLYRADLVRSHDPFFNEADIHADTEVCFALLKASDFGFVHQVLTFSRVRPGSRSAADTENRTDLGGFLEILVEHGHHFLTDDEFGVCLDRHVSAYYKYLGKSLMLGRDETFWNYHKRKLIEADIGFSRMRLVRGMLATLGGALLNPKNSVEKLQRRWRNQNRQHTCELRSTTNSGLEDWAASERRVRHPCDR